MCSIKAIFIIIAVTIPIILQASEPKRIKEFKEEFKDVYIVDGTDIYIQRVIEFPNTSEEELTQMVKEYVSRRLERLGKRASNSNVKYYRNAYIMVERSPAFTINFAFSSAERYTYRIEIKENRIRATISLNEVIWGPMIIPTKDFYPFKRLRGGGKKHMKLFAEYATSTLNSIKDDMKDELSDDNW